MQQNNQEKIQYLVKKTKESLQAEPYYADANRAFLKDDYIRFIRILALLLSDFSNVDGVEGGPDFAKFNFSDEELGILYLLVSKLKSNSPCYFLYMEDEFSDHVKTVLNLAEGFLRSKKISKTTVTTEQLLKFEKQFEKNYSSEIFNIINEDISYFLSSQIEIDFKDQNSDIQKKGLFFYINPVTLLHLKARIRTFEAYAGVDHKETSQKRVNIFKEVLAWKESVIKKTLSSINPVLEQSLFSMENVCDPSRTVSDESSVFKYVHFMMEDIEKLRNFFFENNDNNENFLKILSKYDSNDPQQNRKATFKFLVHLLDHARSEKSNEEQKQGILAEFLLMLRNIVLALAKELNQNKFKVKGNKNKFARYLLEACRKGFNLDVLDILSLKTKQLAEQLGFVARLLLLQSFVLDSKQLKNFKVISSVEVIDFTIDSETNITSKTEKREAAYDIILKLFTANTAENYVRLFSVINTYIPTFRRLGKSQRSTQLEEIVCRLRDHLLDKIIGNDLGFQGTKFSIEQLLEIFANVTDENEVSAKSGDLIRHIVQQSPANEQIYSLHDSLIKNIFNPPKEKNGQKIDTQKYISSRSNMVVKAIAELYRMHRISRIPTPPALHLFAALLNYTVSEYMLKNPQIRCGLSIINARYIYLPKMTAVDLSEDTQGLYKRILTGQVAQSSTLSKEIEDEEIEIELNNNNFNVVAAARPDEEIGVSLKQSVPNELSAFVMLLDQALTCLRAGEYLNFLRFFSSLLIALLEKIKNDDEDVVQDKLVKILEEIVFYSKIEAKVFELALSLYCSIKNPINIADIQTTLFGMLYRNFLVILCQIVSYKEYLSYLPRESIREDLFQGYLDYLKKTKGLREVTEKYFNKDDGFYNRAFEFNQLFYENYFCLLIESIDNLVDCDAEDIAVQKISLLNVNDSLRFRLFYLTNYTVGFLMLNFEQFKEAVRQNKSKRFSDLFYVNNLALLLQKMEFCPPSTFPEGNIMQHVCEGKFHIMFLASCSTSDSQFLCNLSDSVDKKDKNLIRVEFFKDLIGKLLNSSIDDKEKLYKFLLALQLVLTCVNEIGKKDFIIKNKFKISLINATVGLYGVLNVGTMPKSQRDVEQELPQLLKQVIDDTRFIGGIHWFKDKKRLEVLQIFILLLFKAENDKKTREACRKCFELVSKILLVNDGHYESVFEPIFQNEDIMDKWGVAIKKLKQSLNDIEYIPSQVKVVRSGVVSSMARLMQAIGAHTTQPVNDNCSFQS